MHEGRSWQGVSVPRAATIGVVQESRFWHGAPRGDVGRTSRRFFLTEFEGPADRDRDTRTN
jgi:hypothetical protein